MNAAPRKESRIFPAIAVLALPAILSLLPARFRIMPLGVPISVGVLLAIAVLVEGFAPADSLASRVERYFAGIVLMFVAGVELVLLAKLLRDMASAHPGVGGLTLLTTSISIWTTNILVFALAYWLIDRGGPTGRASGWRGRADFSFPRGDPSEGVPEDWQPIFADYLSLAFNTSAAFSPTDVLPLTPRAKMLMMVQSVVSLVTVIAVGARAINILGSSST